MVKLLSFVIVLFFPSVTVFGQIPDFETSEDCLDWFLLSWNQLNGKSACFGNAHVSGSSSEGFLDLEWFEVRFNDRSNHKFFRYIESRRTYANGEQADLWEKSLNRGKEWKWSLGDYSTEMATVQAPEFDEKGDQIAGLPKSKNSKVVEIRAAWEIDDIEASLFSDDSFEKDRSGKGPLFGLRKTLKSKLGK